MRFFPKIGSTLMNVPCPGLNRSGSPEFDQTDDHSGDHHLFCSSGVLPYPRAPHAILGLPLRYCDRGWLVSTGLLPDPEHRRREADKGIGGGRPTRSGNVVRDVLFMASRDGVDFRTPPWDTTTDYQGNREV